jgi:hypothetical protein
VNGGPARGLCPILEGQSVTSVACLDFDSHKGEVDWAGMAAVVERVCDRLTAAGMQPHPWRSSGGNGIHVILLWETPQDAYSVRATLGEVLGACGLKDGAGGVIAKQVEVFPRQNEVGVGEFGNQFILPLAGKSVPLDPLFGFEPLAKSDALATTWAFSEPVAERERPVRDQTSAAPPEELAVVRAALMAIPNDDLMGAPDYFEWRDLCFAVHEATGGSEEGYEVFAEWSRQNRAHDEKFTRQRVWGKVRDADDRTSGAITRGTLFHKASKFGWGSAPAPDAEGFEEVSDEDIAQAKEASREIATINIAAQLDQRFEAKERWKKAIQEAPDERALVGNVLPRIAIDTVLGRSERGMLAEVLKERMTSFGSKVSIADCRRMTAQAKRERKDADSYSEARWSDGWVYVTDEDAFYRLDSEEVLTMQSFNAKYNRLLPTPEENEFRKSASWVALEDHGLNIVTRRVYLPWADGVFDLNGVKCANSFRPSSMPDTAERFTPAGLAALEKIKAHVSLVCGGRQDVIEVMTSWLAWQVQQPGRKVRWAPLVKGVQGDGKTLLGRILSSAMGMPNVKNVSNQVLGTQFQDWAHGACVAVLEEIRLSGHNRFEVLDTLKPYVSNTEVSIHPKGAKPFDVLNTQNYLAFTNHSDALPIDETDRRWFIVFTPFNHISDMEKAVGDLSEYFDALYDALDDHRGEVRKWLMEYPVSPRFKPNGRAPATAEKASMIAMSISTEEDVIKEALLAGGKGISDEVVIVGALHAAALTLCQSEPLTVKDVTLSLKKMGWVKVPGQMKWRGAVVRCWAKGIDPACKEAVRAALDKTHDEMCYLDDPFK